MSFIVSLSPSFAICASCFLVVSTSQTGKGELYITNNKKAGDVLKGFHAALLGLGQSDIFLQPRVYGYPSGDSGCRQEGVGQDHTL